MVNIPSPYRVDFFNKLGEYCDLTVSFEGKYAKNRNKNWKSNQASNFKPIYMKGIRCSNDSFFCPEIIKIISKGWDKIIIGVYSTPTSMLAIEYLRVRKIPFCIEADGGLIKEENKFKYKIKKHYISSATIWFSSGSMTTDYLVYYGAIKKKCFRFPFTSVTENDLIKSLEIKGKYNKKLIENILVRRNFSEENSKYLSKLRNEIRMNARKKLKISEKKVILSVGQFIYRKGIDILIKASYGLDENVGIYIIGGKPTKEYIELKEKCHEAKIYFVNFLKKSELAMYYQAADLFVFPTREDIWGLVINEALSFGLPVITTRKCVAGLEMIKEGVNGSIVSENNAEQLENKLKLYIDSEIPDTYCINSYKVATMYTIERMAEVHMKALENSYD